MKEQFNSWFPNVVLKMPEFTESIVETLQMVLWSGIISFIIGGIIGVVLAITRKDGLCPNAPVFQVTDKLVNLFRSIPFIILLTAIMPLTRAIMGTAIGVRGAIVPLIFGTVPFFARQMETSILQVPAGLIEAAQSMGNGKVQIIFSIYLRESIPQIARAVSITVISLIGLTAMAGAVGAGGLGDFAIRYGHDRNQTDVTLATVIVLILMVTVVQLAGNLIAKKTTH